MPGIFTGAIAGGLMEAAGPTGGGGTPAVLAVPDAAATHIIINTTRYVSTASANTKRGRTSESRMERVGDARGV